MKLSCFGESVGKIASPTTLCIVEREKWGRSCNKLLFFQLHPTYVFVRGGKKIASPMKLFWNKCLAKKQLTIAHVSVVRYTRSFTCFFFRTIEEKWGRRDKREQHTITVNNSTTQTEKNHCNFHGRNVFFYLPANWNNGRERKKHGKSSSVRFNRSSRSTRCQRAHTHQLPPAHTQRGSN